MQIHHFPNEASAVKRDKNANTPVGVMAIGIAIFEFVCERIVEPQPTSSQKLSDTGF